jgi:hypothetical protein
MVFGMDSHHISTHGEYQNPVLLDMNSHGPTHHRTTQCHSPVPQNQSVSWTMVPVAMSPSYEHEKRVRDGPIQADCYQPPPCDGTAPPSSGKKPRQSNYNPPRQVDTKSLLSVTGSLVGGGLEQSATTVRMRRELSGGQLDQFVGNHDNMDDSSEDAVESRRRSMSF